VDRQVFRLYWRSHFGPAFGIACGVFFLGLFALKDSQLFLPSFTEYANTPLIGALPMALGIIVGITVWSPVTDYDELPSHRVNTVRSAHPTFVTLVGVLVATIAATIVFLSLTAGITYLRLFLFWAGMALFGSAMKYRQLTVIIPLTVFLVIAFSGYNEQGLPRLFNPHHRALTDHTAWALASSSILLGLITITTKLRRT